MTTVQFLYLLIIERDLQPTDWCSFMEKDYLRISSTVLVSLLFGLALVLVNSWFNQPGVEEVVPRSTYLMVMIALFFIDTVAFIFMQLYFIYDRRQFSNCVLSLAFLSCLIYFVITVIIIQQIIEERLTREGANKQVISSQADSLIKISRIWADFFPANTSNQPI